MCTTSKAHLWDKQNWIMDGHESIQTKVFRITFTKTAISIETEMGMEISVVPDVYKVKETNSNTPKLFKVWKQSNLTTVGSW